MTIRDLPSTMEKCVRHVGGTQVFYYACRNGNYILVDPATGDIFTDMTESHFKKCYLPYSVNLPPAILAEMDALPPFREWKRGRENG